MAHHEIYFRAYHTGENGDYEALRPAKSGGLQILWDSYQDQYLMEDLKLDPEIINQIYRARILLHSSRTAIYSATEVGSKLYNDQLDQPSDRGDVLLLSLWTDEALTAFKDQFAEWMYQTCLKADEVGGDDSTYDYYPDNWDVAAQLATALGMEDAYREHWHHLTSGNGRYAQDDLPDYIKEI